jgi:hypothetical protein
MTKPEFMQVYNILDAVFGLEFDSKKLDAWYEALNNIKFEKLMMAANRYIETEKYKPKPADLIRLAAEMRPPIKNDSFKCGLCNSCGFIGVELLIDTSKGKEPVIFYYRCKCDLGQRISKDVQTIMDDILNTMHRDIFGIYRVEKPTHKAIPTEDIQRELERIGRF